MRQHPRAALQVFGFTVGPAVITYAWTAYLPTLAVTDGGLAEGDSLRSSTISLVFLPQKLVLIPVFLLAQPVFGALSDRIGRTPVVAGSALCFVIGSPFMIGAIDGTFFNLVVIQSVGLVVLSGATSVAGALMAELFPARVRVAGIAFPYAVSVALFGGTTPFVATGLQNAGHIAWFAFYISGVSLITLVTVLTFSETARRPLPQ